MNQEPRDRRMTRRRKIVAAIAVAATAGAGVAATHHGGTGATLMPASVPVTNPAVTQANIATTICVSGWTATVRPPTSVTGPIKARLERQTGIPASAELDHAVPLELGGWPGADGRNLWLEPQPRAATVDKIENQLHRQVCAGTITLTAAQAQIVKVKETAG